MAAQYLNAPGERVPPDDLRIARARELGCLLQAKALPFAWLVDTRRGGSGQPASETVVFDVEIERSQVRVHDIHRRERVAVTFGASDDWYPEVVVLRDDFPRCPHQNRRDDELPRSLCLYELSWDQVKLGWTAASFINRVRYWLAQTANGALHQEDQPLEPLFFAEATIVIPRDLFDAEKAVPRLRVTLPGGKDGRVFVATRDGPPDQSGLEYTAVAFRCPPQQHGVIHRTPKSLKDLHDLALAAGLDLLGELRTRLKEWRRPAVLPARLIIIIAFPKTRAAGAAVEATDLLAFFSLSTVKEIGEQVGIWQDQNGSICPLIGDPDPSRIGQGVALTVLSPQFSLSRSAAASLNGLKGEEKRKMVAVGVGSLGSHVLTNLARAGFGQWSVIDNDYLLPHNLARHSLDGTGIGYDKVVRLTASLNSLYADTDAQKFIVNMLPANLLRPGPFREQVSAVLNHADVILDISADLPVARHLACDVDSKARRMSLFFNPAGDAVVLLAEDADRKHRLDSLEMQYYREVSTRPVLSGHLRRSQEGRVRYAQSCRDLTSRIPQDNVALLSAIGSRAYRDACAGSDAAIRIWLLDEQRLSVDSLNIGVPKGITYAFGEWTLVTDTVLAAKVHRLRKQRLPRETGGILLGSFDLSRKTVYVVDTIPSPPDSKEWPTLYIRGHDQLPAMVQEVQKRTAGNLEYVGEWHSHPNGCSTCPSEDDTKVFAWLTDRMDVDGRPALMLIAGDRRQTFYVERIM